MEGEVAYIHVVWSYNRGYLPDSRHIGYVRSWTCQDVLESNIMVCHLTVTPSIWCHIKHCYDESKTQTNTICKTLSSEQRQ